MPDDYQNMSDLALMQLCIWRESRGEPYDGKRGVAHVIKNRSVVSSWWNKHTLGSIAKVILQPWQFSSFNPSDPNADKWPSDDDPSFSDCCAVALAVLGGSDADNTSGATHYYDDSLAVFPRGWGNQADYVHTVDIGRLKFFRYVEVTGPQTFLDESD